jgi:hypothetical protein
VTSKRKEEKIQKGHYYNYVEKSVVMRQFFIRLYKNLFSIVIQDVGP